MQQLMLQDENNLILKVKIEEGPFMITFKHKGDFSRLTRFLQRAKEVIRLSDLDKYGRAGVDALASATPKDSGETASSWYYEINHSRGSIRINFLILILIKAFL